MMKFKYKPLNEFPSCSFVNVSSVQRCGRKLAIFCNDLGITSTGQKQPESITVGVISKFCKAPAALRLFEKEIITNETPTAINENSNITKAASQNVKLMPISKMLFMMVNV